MSYPNFFREQRVAVMTVLSGITGLCLIVFKHAFDIHFFQDDYWFLAVSRINSITGFLHFFDPFRSYSYKPLASETFYLIIHWLNYNAFWSHAIMFVTFFIGIVFLYKIIVLLTNNLSFAVLAVGLYAIHFTHVFQLYWFATYQEIAVFMFLSLSLYALLKHQFFAGFLAFTAALLCKETAALFPGILLLVTIIDTKRRISAKTIIMACVLSGLFYLVYRYSLSQVTSLENYKMVFNPRLIANNMVWYLLWGIGFPNIMPLYMPKLAGLPIPDFWRLFGFPDFKMYFIFFLLFLVVFGIGLAVLLFPKKPERKQIGSLLLIGLAGFFLTLGPILFFPHRWMVRLTMPVLFISLFEGYVLYLLITRVRFGKHFSLIILGLYLLFNYYGILFHESSGLYQSENNIYLNTAKYFQLHGQEIAKHQVIFLKDEPWKKTITSINSERLKNSYHDQSFIDHFLPGSSIQVLYNFETETVPPSAYTINTNDIIN